MSERTNISWCDSTLNFWEGCTKVSAGCQHCYAEARDKRFTGGKLWGKGSPRRKSKSAIKDAFTFNRKPWICDECGAAYTLAEFNDEHAEMCSCPSTCHRRRIFSLSLGDWLDDEVPIEWLAEMLDTIRQCDQVTWILCTKRPENFKSRLNAVVNKMDRHGITRKWDWITLWTSGVTIPKNIILLASVENQATADLRIPQLLKIPAACHGLSLEPLLGPVLIDPMQAIEVDWWIIGGESGSNARHCDVEWIRHLIQQGQMVGGAVFVKQLGTNIGLKDKKGGDPSEWPADLRIQEFPVLQTNNQKIK